jgi:AAA domain
MTPTEYSPVDLPQLEGRRAMHEHGYEPIPLNGKVPILENWQTRPIAVEQWGSMGTGTGMRTKNVPVFDVDILDEQAAQIVAATVRLSLEDKGEILERVGAAPKCAIPMRTDKPFKKIVRKFQAPDGMIHKIEVLGDGQQLAVFGTHPDTGKPWVWKDGKSPVNTPRDRLPLADEQLVHTILDLCAGELKEKLGWTEVDAAPKTGGRIQPAGFMDNIGPSINLDGMTPGVDVNETLWRAVGSQLCRGTRMDDVVADLVEKGMSIAPNGKWTAEEQRIEVEGMCLRTILNKPELEDLLSDRYRQQLERLRADGYKTFKVSKNRYGPYFRPSSTKDEQDEIPTVEAKQENDGHKYRFRLVNFQDMRPGLEPTYLVDELIPSAGLVLVWGKQKTFKSFWLLDLLVHVAMGWAYRDHAVRKGTVIYCAFEGGHGYKGRIEALRRHYKIADNVEVPLFVMPGQVDLIKDAQSLVKEFQAQLLGEIPAVVVLDTLNRSLSGSESSDKDMTLYVKAAEEIRKAFGCVCIIVHHCGYDDTHARGHTSLPAAVDAELSVERDASSPLMIVTVRQMRDGPEGMVVHSRAQSVALDADQNGKPRSSIVIVPGDTTDSVGMGRHKGRPGNALPVLVEALRAAIETKGEYFVPEGKVPLQAADQKTVRDIFGRRYIDGEEDEQRSKGACKQAFKRAIEAAVEGGTINGEKTTGGRQLLWFARDEGVLEK